MSEKQTETYDKLTSRLDCALNSGEDDSLQKMMYVLGHDLNAPLRQVCSFSELIQKNYASQLDEKGERWLSLLHNGSKKMQQMLAGVLRYSRVWTAQEPFSELDLNQLMDQLVYTQQKDSETKAAKISWGNLPSIYGIQSLWTLILSELIQNAIYFQPEGQSAEVNVAFNGDASGGVLSVMDNGLGVDEKYHAKLTDLFFRCFSEKEYPSDGIGLALCQRALQRHAGRISFCNNPDKGLTAHCHITADYLVGI